MKTLDSKLLADFLDIAIKELKGRWLLVGGTLLPAVGLDVRSTVDIDIVGLGEKEKLQNLELMTIAEKLGLSVETINQAAEFFVSKINIKDDDLIILKKSTKTTIYRPRVEIYWKLKLERLSESDMLDCQHYLNYCKSQNDKIYYTKLTKLIEAKLEEQQNPEKYERYKKLIRLLPSH